MSWKLPSIPGLNTNAGIEGAVSELIMPGSGLIVAAAGNMDPNFANNISSDVSSAGSSLGNISLGGGSSAPTTVPVLSGTSAASTRTYIIFGIVFMIIIIAIAVIVSKHKTT